RLPVLQGLLPLAHVQLGPDILAGITLAALGIPEVMGYTRIIGTPIITGLYTLFLPVLAFAILGSSRYLVVSADSATAAMVAAALTARAFTANTPQYIELTSLIALVTAAILLLARVLRLGFLADFLSRTVLVGFLTGVGIQVAGGELQDMLGLKIDGHGFLRQFFLTFTHLGSTHLPSLFIALAALAIIVGFELFAPRFSGALLAVIALTAASAFFHWGARGISVVGSVPSGLPHIGLPHLTMSNMALVAPISFSCFIVILAQSAATSRAYALRYRDAFDQNADLVGLSLANALSGVSGAFVVNGSPTKTAIVDTAGGRSQWSHVTTAVVVGMVLLFATHPLSFLPNAVLATIVFVIGVKLIDYKGLAAIWRAAPNEFFLALITAATVVIFGVEQGIVLAVILSLLMHVRNSYRPHVGVVVPDDADHWRIEDPEPGLMAEPGMVIFWFGSGLFYANASFFVEQVHRLIDDAPKPVRWLVIDARAVTEMDYSAGEALTELHEDLSKAGIVLGMIVVQTHRDSLNRLGLVKLLGADRIFDSRHECVQAYRAEMVKLV
ncbi:MAG: SulP family inorganic anion transporter, partial [Acidobacteriaceae bacterium]|nr:SulP family inorganic anion transporter [Acidobacteriaceae bacterium]